MTCGSFCIGRFMHPGWAWGRLGGGACRPLPPCPAGGLRRPAVSTRVGRFADLPSPHRLRTPAPIPESALCATAPRPSDRPGPPRPHWSEKLIAVCVGEGEPLSSGRPPAGHSSPIAPPLAPCPCVPGARGGATCVGGRVMQRMRAVAGTLAAGGEGGRARVGWERKAGAGLGSSPFGSISLPRIPHC
jgi:hypothetical protein